MAQCMFLDSVGDLDEATNSTECEAEKLGDIYPMGSEERLAIYMIL